MIYMDRKTTTFIILLGLIIASSLFQGCIEGNQGAPEKVLDTLEFQKEKQEKELERLKEEKNKATVMANTPCTEDDDDCAIEKRVAKDYIIQIKTAIEKAEIKIKDLKNSIKAIKELQALIKKQQEEIAEQNIEIRKSQNSAQGSSYALGQLSPNIIKQREIQNETKRQLAEAIKKVHTLS